MEVGDLALLVRIGQGTAETARPHALLYLGHVREVLRQHRASHWRPDRLRSRLDIIDGEALFRLKKELSRPVIVLSSGTRVLAVGTRFDVYRKATGTSVTVPERRVAASGASAPTEAAGSNETIGSRETEVPIFLSEAVAELNRYNSRRPPARQ